MSAKFQDEQVNRLPCDFSFHILDDGFNSFEKSKRKPLGNFFVENFRDLKVIASRRPKIAACNYICY